MKKLVFYFGLIAILYQSSAVFSQWSQIGPNYGSSNDPAPLINNFFVVGDTLFGCNNVFGVHYSTDFGGVWCETGMTAGNNKFIAKSGNVILTGTSSINRSTNNGDTYSPTSVTATLLSLDFKKNIAIAGTTNGIYLSTNYGANWINPIVSGSYSGAAILDSTIFIGNSAGVSRSTNKGASFEVVLPLHDITRLQIVGTSVMAISSGGIDISYNHGNVWNPLYTGQNVKACTIVYSDLFMAMGNTIQKSTNGGENWSVVFNAGAPLSNVINLNGNLVALSTSAICLSRDTGQTWVQNKFHFMQAYSVYKTANSFFSSSNNFGIYRSTNSGNSWNNFTLTNDFWAVRTFAERSGFLFCAQNNGGVYLSTNDGASFSLISTLVRTIYTLYPVGQNLLAGTQAGGIYYSQNDGTTWSPTNLNNQTIYCFHGNTNKLFAGGTGAGLYFSANAGGTWSPVAGITQPIGGITSYSKYVFAGGSTGIYVSSDYGDTWSQTSFPYPYVNALASYGSNVFAGTEKNGFFISSDNGTTWININKNLGPRISVSRIFIRGNDLYGATYTSSIVRAPLSTFIGINQISTELPDDFSLKQNYPNPFNPNTIINFSLKSSGFISLKVYDIRGTEIAELVNQKMNAGTFSFTFDASNYNLSSGVYFYKLKAGEFENVKRMVLVK